MERELTVLLIHGLLHLTGYDHEKDKDYKIMREKESEILKELFAMFGKLGRTSVGRNTKKDFVP